MCDQRRIGYAGHFLPTAVPITRRAMVRASIQLLDAWFHDEIQYLWDTPTRVNAHTREVVSETGPVFHNAHARKGGGSPGHRPGCLVAMAVHESQRILDPRQPEVELFRRQVDKERATLPCGSDSVAAAFIPREGDSPSNSIVS